MEANAATVLTDFGADPSGFVGRELLDDHVIRADLVLTATGDLSRNRKVGLLLAQGRTLEQAVASLGHVAEGVYSARTVLARLVVATAGGPADHIAGGQSAGSATEVDRDHRREGTWNATLQPVAGRG